MHKEYLDRILDDGDRLPSTAEGFRTGLKLLESTLVPKFIDVAKIFSEQGDEEIAGALEELNQRLAVMAKNINPITRTHNYSSLLSSIEATMGWPKTLDESTEIHDLNDLRREIVHSVDHLRFHMRDFRILTRTGTHELIKLDIKSDYYRLAEGDDQAEESE